MKWRSMQHTLRILHARGCTAMRSPASSTGALVLCATVAAPALAAGIDGSRSLLCSTVEANDCASGTARVRGLPQDIDVPPFVKLDFAGRTISARGRTSAIQRAARLNGMLIVQGSENSRAFSITVSESTGKLVGAIAGDGEAFVLFGACSPL
jgi:hypothetical protein